MPMIISIEIIHPHNFLPCRYIAAVRADCPTAINQNKSGLFRTMAESLLYSKEIIEEQAQTVSFVEIISPTKTTKYSWHDACLLSVASLREYLLE